MEQPSLGPEAPLLYYWHVLSKRKAIILGFTLTVTICVLALTLVSTPIYQSKAVIDLRPNAPLIMNNVHDIDENEFNIVDARFRVTEKWLMRSRGVLEEAVRRLKEEHGVKDFDGVADPYSLLLSRVYVEEMLGTHLIDLVAEHPEPEKAALYANVFAETYIDKNLERSTVATDEALLWLAKQQELYRQKNYQSEQSVEEYKAEHGLFSLENRTVSSETLSELQAQWSSIHTQLEIVEAEVDSYKKIIGEGQVLSLADHLSNSRPVIEKSLLEYREREQYRSSLKTTLLAKHPEVLKVDEELTSIKAQIRDELDVYIQGREAEAKIVRSQERRLGKAIKSAHESMAAQGRAMIPLKFLTASAQRDQHFYETLDQRMAELALQQFLRGNNVRIVTPARVPSAPYKPNLFLNMMTGLLVGALGGIVVGIILDAIDTTVRSREDVEAAAGAPMLGLVPLVDTEVSAVEGGQIDGVIYSHAMPRSPLAECLRTVRTNIQFRWGQGELRSLLVTSASPKEGKSFISANLAAVMAASGKRTLIIDADLRRPSLHKRFGLPRTVGLVNFLQREAELMDVVQKTTVPGADLLAAGPNVNNPSEMLQSSAVERLVSVCLEHYDLVIIDTPPINVVSDPLVIAAAVDGVVYVVQASKTPKHLVQTCCDRLREVNQKILGTVVNKQDIVRAGYEYNYYYYDYYHYYSTAEERNMRQTDQDTSLGA